MNSPKTSTYVICFIYIQQRLITTKARTNWFCVGLLLLFCCGWLYFDSSAFHFFFSTEHTLLLLQQQPGINVVLSRYLKNSGIASLLLHSIWIKLARTQVHTVRVVVQLHTGWDGYELKRNLSRWNPWTQTRRVKVFIQEVHLSFLQEFPQRFALEFFEKFLLEILEGLHLEFLGGFLQELL